MHFSQANVLIVNAILNPHDIGLKPVCIGFESNALITVYWDFDRED